MSFSTALISPRTNFFSGECMRLGDVIEKTQSELNTSKIQLSQIQRQEAQSRQELDSIRSLTNNKDKRGKELQVRGLRVVPPAENFLEP